MDIPLETLREAGYVTTENRAECANCHVKLLRSTEWWCPACQSSRRELQAEVERLREWKADILEATRVVMEEDCDGENHCMCVPLLKSAVTAWHEYAMSCGCSHHDNVWYDPEGNAILEGK